MASILNNETKYKSDFINFQKDISIANAGEFSQYWYGNLMLLSVYGLLSIDELREVRPHYYPYSKDFHWCIN